MVNEKVTMEGVEKTVNRSKLKLLWENPSPRSSFSSQTVTVEDMSEYDYIKVFYSAHYSRPCNRCISFIYEPEYSGSAARVYYLTETIVEASAILSFDRRMTIVSATSVTFADSYTGTCGASSYSRTVNSERMIPIAIYGGKFAD